MIGERVSGGPTNAATHPLVEFREVVKSFGGNRVLDCLNLTINAGEKVVLIGPSGSGKTTILRVLMTLEKPDSGVVHLDGQPLWHQQRGERMVPADAQHLRRMRSQVGMVFQQFNLFPHMNALQNVTEALIQVKRTPRREADQVGRALLAQVGLGDRAEAYPWQLSGGQQQRVAIARAIALAPRVLLCDEVTSALDPELVGEVQQVLRDLAKASDVTMLIVTHHMAFARDIADRVLMFDKGSAIEQGSPDQVLDAPTHERTRKFLQAVHGAA
jgi:polar amino acid transport system ATP-binding protein